MVGNCAAAQWKTGRSTAGRSTESAPVERTGRDHHRIFSNHLFIFVHYERGAAYSAASNNGVTAGRAAGTFRFAARLSYGAKPWITGVDLLFYTALLVGIASVATATWTLLGRW